MKWNEEKLQRCHQNGSWKCLLCFLSFFLIFYMVRGASKSTWFCDIFWTRTKPIQFRSWSFCLSSHRHRRVHDALSFDATRHNDMCDRYILKRKLNLVCSPRSFPWIRYSSCTIFNVATLLMRFRSIIIFFSLCSSAVFSLSFTNSEYVFNDLVSKQPDIQCLLQSHLKCTTRSNKRMLMHAK